MERHPVRCARCGPLASWPPGTAARVSHSLRTREHTQCHTGHAIDGPAVPVGAALAANDHTHKELLAYDNLPFLIFIAASNMLSSPWTLAA